MAYTSVCFTNIHVFRVSVCCTNALVFIQWLPELQHYAPGVPIVLAGTKLGELCDNDIFPFLYLCEIMGTTEVYILSRRLC